MRRSAIIALAAVGLAACGGSKLSEAPQASSLQACLATRDAVDTAGAIVWANKGKYPATFGVLTSGPAPLLSLPDGVTVSGKTLKGNGWTLTMSGGGDEPPTLTCEETAPTT
jgi:hypothetical protein